MEKQALHGFRIYRQEPLQETFQRILNEQISYSIDLCKSCPDDPDFSTHEIRKSTKRIRSIYRLFTPAIGKEAFTHENEFFGNISRLLADHRASRVHLDNLRHLYTDRKLLLVSEFLEEEILRLEKQHQALTNRLFHKTRLDRQIKQMFLDGGKKITRESPARVEFSDLAEGMQETYKKAKQQLQLIEKEMSAENLHELRKKVKAIWNQMLLLKPLWPGYTAPAIHQFDLLAEKLGMEHDLSELERQLAKTNVQKNPEYLKLLMDHIAINRMHLQKTIIPLASRLFVEKPGNLARRMTEYHKLFIAGK